MYKRLFLSAAARRRTSWIIAGVLILPFIFFFHGSIRESMTGAGGAAGTLFGKRIPRETFEQHRLWSRIKLGGQLGGAPASLLEPLIAQYTWERLMLVHEAKRRGLRVDDLELARLIQSIPDFQQNGRFLPERYQQFLTAIRMSPQLFEEVQRDDLLVDKLLDQVRGSTTVTDEDVRNEFIRRHEQLEAAVIAVESASTVEEAARTVTDDEVTARYAAQPDRYKRPEQVAFEYAEFTRDSVLAGVTPTDEELQAYYEAHPSDYAREDGSAKPLDEVRENVRQAWTTEKARKALTGRALDFQDDLDANRPFEEIVSARGAVKRTAGPLDAHGPAPADGPEPAILQAVADLPVGKLTEVIQTPSGTYVARVTERLPSELRPIEEVRDGIREELIRERSRELARQRAEALRSALDERMAAGWRFEEAVLAQDIPVVRAQFTRAAPIEPLGYEPRVNQAAFDAPLGRLTPVVEAPLGFAILRPEARLPVDESTLAEEAERLRAEALTKRQGEQLQAWMREVRSRANLKSFLEEPTPNFPAGAPPIPGAAGS